MRAPSGTARHLGAAALGAALWGLSEAGGLLWGERLLLSTPEQLLVGTAGVIGAAGIGLVSGLLLLRWKNPLSGLLAGVIGNAALSTALWWFEDPPPFQDTFLFKGNPIVFIGLLLVWTGVGVALKRGGPRISAVVLLAGLGLWVLSRRSVEEAPDAVPPAGAPNVLLVTMDTVRADRFGAYGNTKVDTRYFDALAAQGTLFSNTSAVAAVTAPSHTSMLSGSGPWEHGVLLNGIPLPEDRPMLAELLHDRGSS